MNNFTEYDFLCHDLNNVDNQISVLMNDPNYKDLITKVDKFLGVKQTGPVSMTGK